MRVRATLILSGTWVGFPLRASLGASRWRIPCGSCRVACRSTCAADAAVAILRRRIGSGGSHAPERRQDAARLRGQLSTAGIIDAAREADTVFPAIGVLGCSALDETILAPGKMVTAEQLVILPSSAGAGKLTAYLPTPTCPDLSRLMPSLLFSIGSRAPAGRRFTLVPQSGHRRPTVGRACRCAARIHAQADRVERAGRRT